MKNKANKALCKRSIISLLCVSILCSLFSCERDSNSGNRSGKLFLLLDTDTTYQKSISMKSISDEFNDFLDVSDYSVSISQGSKEVISFSRYEEMPEEIILPVGLYTLSVHKGENKPGAFLNPFFAGTIDFQIEEEMKTPVTAICTLANTRVTVNYTDDFSEVFPSCKVHLNTTFLKQEVITFDEQEIRAAYFQSDKTGTSLKIELEVFKTDGEEAVYYKPNPISIEPRQNVNLLFKPEGTTENTIGLEVTLNNDMDDVILDIDIPEEMLNGK